MKVQLLVDAWSRDGEMRSTVYVVSSALQLFDCLMRNRHRQRVHHISARDRWGQEDSLRHIAWIDRPDNSRRPPVSIPNDCLTRPDEVDRVAEGVWRFCITSLSTYDYDRTSNVQPRTLKNHTEKMKIARRYK